MGFITPTKARLHRLTTPSSKPETSLLIRDVEEDQEDEQPDSKVRKPAKPAGVDLLHLEESKQAQLHHLLDQYPSMFCQRPGRTNLVHQIHLLDPTPSRQRTYQVPERLVAPLRAEILR